MTDTPLARRYTAAQIVLGLFIVGQLIFLASSNILGLFPHGEPSDGELSDSRNCSGSEKFGGLIQSAIDVAGNVADRWGFLTGQVQAWWLFAPDFPKQATFPAVELIWVDQNRAADAARTGEPSAHSPVLLLSMLEPGNPHRYFKAPGSSDRLFHYEARLGLIMLFWDEDLVNRFPAEWREAVLNRVRRQWKSIRAYLRWRLLQFQAEHPNLAPPTQAILRIRVFRSPRPEQSPIEWEGPFNLPLARWQLESNPKPGFLPVEAFDPIAQRFVALRGEE